MYQHNRRKGPRWEYKDQESQRVRNSATLSASFEKLKSLTVDLRYHTPEGNATSSHITYDVNLDNAKSVFRVECRNDECIQGDFDLSQELATAIGKKKTSVTGELCCQGWRSKVAMNTTHCHNILRYKLKLAY